MDARGWLFVAENAVIFTAYVFVAAWLAPLLPVRLVTRAHAVVFFATCGYTHFEQLLHVLVEPTVPLIEQAVEWHMWVLHGVQAYSIVAFVVLGTYDLRVFWRRVQLHWRVASESAPKAVPSQRRAPDDWLEATRRRLSR